MRPEVESACLIGELARGLPSGSNRTVPQCSNIASQAVSDCLNAQKRVSRGRLDEPEKEAWCNGFRVLESDQRALSVSG